VRRLELNTTESWFSTASFDRRLEIHWIQLVQLMTPSVKLLAPFTSAVPTFTAHCPMRQTAGSLHICNSHTSQYYDSGLMDGNSLLPIRKVSSSNLGAKTGWDISWFNPSLQANADSP